MALSQLPFERWALVMLIAFYLVGNLLFGAAAHGTLNVVGPLTLAAILLYGAYKIAGMHPSGIWLASVWLRITVACYFAIGSAIPFFVNEFTRQYIDAFYHASPEEFLKVNMLTVLGTFVIFLTMSVLAHLFPPPPPRASAAPSSRISDMLSAASDHSLLRLGFFFGIIGFVVKDLIVLPYTLGLTTIVVPAFFLQVSHFTAIGIFLLARWALRRGRGYIVPVLLFTLFDAAIGVLAWSKTDAIFPILMFALAVISAKPTLLRMAVSSAALLGAFYTLKPVVDYGRSVTLEKYGHIVGADLGERIQIMTRYLEVGDEVLSAAQVARRAEFQSAASRFAYISQSAYAISLYDAGVPGNSFSYVPVVLIPRVLWPEKPNLNEIGLAFNMAATGGDTSLSWPGPFAESYWNFGWWGIPIFMIPTALLFYFLSRYTYIVFQQQQWARFPVVLFGVKAGVEIGVPFATAIAGSLTYLIVMHLICRAIEHFMGIGAPDTSGSRNALR